MITSKSGIIESDPGPIVLNTNTWMFAIQIEQISFIEKPLFNISLF